MLFDRIIDLLIYITVSFFTTIINLSLINAGFWLLNGGVFHYETWHCLLAYAITSIITFKFLFTGKD